MSCKILLLDKIDDRHGAPANRGDQLSSSKLTIAWQMTNSIIVWESCEVALLLGFFLEARQHRRRLLKRLGNGEMGRAARDWVTSTS